MPINSRAKGARFERLLASKFREHGYDCRRGQQYCGANGDADVVGLPHIHVEAKSVERMQLYDWMAQAKRDSRDTGKLPAVFHKKNNAAILVTMEFDDWMQIYREWEASQRPDIEIPIFDQEEIIENCTVQILTNTETGEHSVGWWRNEGKTDG